MYTYLMSPPGQKLKLHEGEIFIRIVLKPCIVSDGIFTLVKVYTPLYG